jgi:predicted enzyme related to lactoylglutathione lyase
MSQVRKNVMASNPVRWFEIYVQDMARAKTFYETVFKLKIEKLDSPGKPELEYWTFPQMNMDQPGTSGALVKPRASSRPAAGSRTTRCRSGNTDSSRWCSTARAT